MTQNPRSRQTMPHVNGFTKTATPSDKTPASPAWPELCYVLRHKVIAFLGKQEDSEVIQSTQSHILAAIGVIEEAIRRYRPEEISLSYNGGKDCLVLLVLILASLPASS